MSADEDDVKVVLEQTLLKVEEVFVYRIPPMMTSGGHHADDWNLATPLETCALLVIRQDSALLLQLLNHKPKQGGPTGATEQHLFAQCKVQLQLDPSPTQGGGNTPSGGLSNKTQTHPPTPKIGMEHWVEAVVDSSRYFVIRISDERTKREAHIGIGFRERNDAMNFKMSLNEYENAMRKESLAASFQMEEDSHMSQEGDGDTDGNGASNSNETDGLPIVSNLSLKEGEKIHVNIKGGSKKSNRPPRKTGGGSIGGLKPPPSGGLLLRKPPPSATGVGAIASSKPGAGGLPPTSPATGASTSIYINTEAMAAGTNTSSGNGNVSSIPPLSLADSQYDLSSVAAVAETSDTMDEDDEDEDEWGDFTTGTGESQD